MSRVDPSTYRVVAALMWRVVSEGKRSVSKISTPLQVPEPGSWRRASVGALGARPPRHRTARGALREGADWNSAPTRAARRPRRSPADPHAPPELKRQRTDQPFAKPSGPSRTTATPSRSPPRGLEPPRRAGRSPPDQLELPTWPSRSTSRWFELPTWPSRSPPRWFGYLEASLRVTARAASAMTASLVAASAVVPATKTATA